MKYSLQKCESYLGNENSGIEKSMEQKTQDENKFSRSLKKSWEKNVRFAASEHMLII